MARKTGLERGRVRLAGRLGQGVVPQFHAAICSGARGGCHGRLSPWQHEALLQERRAAAARCGGLLCCRPTPAHFARFCQFALPAWANPPKRPIVFKRLVLLAL